MNSIEEIIGRIYEAALVPGQWKEALDHLAALAECSGGLLVSARDHIANRTMLTDNVAELHEIATRDGWWTRNTRGQRLLTLPQNSFHSDADHFSLEDMAREPVYRDLLWPLGWGFATATHVTIPNGDSLILSLERARKDGPVPRRAVARLTELRPHIARSALLASRLAFESVRSANEAFGKTGLPSAAINIHGRVVDSNDLFGVRFGETGSHGERLRLSSPESNRVLEECLSALKSGEGAAALASRSIALPRTETTPPAVLHLVPVKGFARDIFATAAYFIILTPLDITRLAPTDLIQALFDLTAMEARVARTLAAGSNIGSAAASFGISRETVRAHLKSIFAKTGLSRQSDLAAAISLVRTIE